MEVYWSYSEGVREGEVRRQEQIQAAHGQVGEVKGVVREESYIEINTRSEAIGGINNYMNDMRK